MQAFSICSLAQSFDTFICMQNALRCKYLLSSAATTGCFVSSPHETRSTWSTIATFDMSIRLNSSVGCNATEIVLCSRATPRCNNYWACIDCSGLGFTELPCASSYAPGTTLMFAHEFTCSFTSNVQCNPVDVNVMPRCKQQSTKLLILIISLFFMQISGR